MIDRTARLGLARDVRFRRVDHEGVVLCQDPAEVLVVNELGAALLALIDGRRSAAELVEALEHLYEVFRERLEADVLLYLDELHGSGVLRTDDDPEGG